MCKQALSTRYFKIQHFYGLMKKRGCHMKFFPNAVQMKAADQYSTEYKGVSSMELMERAARSCMKRMDALDLSAVCIVCGTGNNGGDGLAIARLLWEQGHQPTVVLLGNRQNTTKETEKQLELYETIGGQIRTTYEEKEYSVIVDAIFGVGLNREIKGVYREVIKAMNRSKAVTLAVDIPSGISASMGSVLGAAVMADITVTFQQEKLGMVLYPGCAYLGSVEIEDIGIDCTLMEQDSDTVYTYGDKECFGLLPKRMQDSHKGTYGKLLIIAGTKGMAGAAYLNALAAYRMGAGLVQLYTHEKNRTILQQMIPEAIVTTYEFFDEGELIRLLKWADGVLIGSGFGVSDTSKKILQTTMEGAPCPCVIDADAINLIAEHKKFMNHRMHNHYIMTPHMGEMSRLLHVTMEELKEKRQEHLEAFVSEYEITCVLKDARTLVKSSNCSMYLNQTGTPAMAKAGSGDVLAGAIAGLLVQGVDCNIAAILGVHFHGRAGEAAELEKGSYSVLAREIADCLSTVLKKGEETI